MKEIDSYGLPINTFYNY